MCVFFLSNIDNVMTKNKTNVNRPKSFFGGGEHITKSPYFEGNRVKVTKSKQ